jgi:hypothetical protein
MTEQEELQRLEEEREFAMLEQQRQEAASEDEGGFFKALDIYTGAAPTRRAVGRMQEGDFEKAATGFFDPFSGEGAVQAPSGKDIMVKAGVPDVGIRTGDVTPEMVSARPDIFITGPEEGSEYNLQDIAGFAGEMAMDPSSLTPPGLISKAGKGMARLAKPVTSRMGKAGKKMLGRAAEKRLIKAGMPVRDYQRLFDNEFLPKKMAKQMAKWLKDEPGITPFSTFETIAQKSGKSMDDAGREIGKLYDEATLALQNKLAAEGPKGQLGMGEFFHVDDMPSRAMTPNELRIMEARFNPLDDKEAIIATISKKLEGFDGKTNALKKIDKYLEQIAGESGRHLDPKQVHKVIKKISQQMIKWKQVGSTASPAKNEAFLALRELLVENVHGQINVLDKLVDSKTLGRLKDLNKRYASTANINGFSFSKAVREKYKRINLMEKYGQMGMASLPFISGGASMSDVPVAFSIYAGLKSYKAAKEPTKILVNELVGKGLLAAEDVKDFLKYAQPEFTLPTKALLRGPLRSEVQGPEGSQIQGPEEQ